MENVKWPEGFGPENCRIFSHNQIWTPLSAQALWAKLIRAQNWPGWYPNSRDVNILDGSLELKKGSVFTWKTFGLKVRSQVLIFEPFEHLGWDAQEMLGWHGFHGWRFIPHNSGTLIITQEIQKGVGDFLVAPVVKKTLEKGHQMWLENLVRE